MPSCPCSTRSSATPSSSPTPATSTPSGSICRRMPPPIRRCCSRPRSSRPIAPSSTARSRPRPASGRSGAARTEAFMDRLAVAFGCEILEIVPGPGLDRGRRAAQLRHRRHHRQGAGAHRALRGRGRVAGARAHQDRQHLGGHPGRRGARARGHPLQPHAALQLRAGGGLRRSRRHADLAVRRPHLRLLPEGGRAREIPVDADPGRRVGAPHLRLLQEARLRDAGDGRELPPRRADHAAGRQRPAHHQPRPARRRWRRRQATSSRR